MNSVAVKPPGSRLLRAGIVAFVAIVVSWVVYDVVSGRTGALDPVDLSVYRDGGLIVRHIRPYYDPHAYAPLYDWGGYSSLALKFTYTPFAAVAFAVVSFIPMKALEVVSVIVNIASLLVALWFTFRALGYSDRRVRLGATLLAAAVTFWLQPVVRTIYLGQINLILMAAIIWDLTQAEFTKTGKRRWWAGAVTGIAAGIKLVPLIFIPYLLLTKRFREAAMTVAGFLATVLIGFAVLPHDSSKWWLHGLIFNDGNRTGFTGWAGNQSLRAIITRLSGSINAGTKPWLVAAFVAVILGIVAAALIDRAGHRMVAILTVSLTGLLASPISWDHHWVWVAPGVAVTAHYAIRAWKARDKWRARWTAAIGLAIIFVFGAWPDALWENERHLGKFSLGFLWAQQNTSPKQFSEYGDQPQYVEYHWHGFQLLWGNIYILFGMAMLLVLCGIAFRLRHAVPARREAEPSEFPASVPASLPRRRMRYLAAITLALAVLFGVGVATGGQAHAAAPVPVVPPASPATLTQEAAGTWTTDLYLDTAALCGDTFDLVTGAPATGTPATTVTYDGSATAPCGAAQDGAVTKVEATFPALPDGAVPQNATLVVTPPAADLTAGADPVEVALTVRRDVSVMQYLWIPLGCGVGLAILLILLTMLIGVPRPDGTTAHRHREKFWRMPLYASSAWTFSDSWVTNITAVGTLIGTVLTASSSVASLLPGVDAPRFSLLLAMAGGFAVLAPVIFGLLNYRFGRQNPQAAGIVAIRLPEQNGDVRVRLDVGGSVAVPGGAALDGGRVLNPGTTLDIPVGTVVTLSGRDGDEILLLQASNKIVVPPTLRVTLTRAVIVPSSAVQAAPASRPAEAPRGVRPAGTGLASRLRAFARPDDTKTATDTASHPPPAPATVTSLTVAEGATLTFVGRAEVTLPAGSTVGAVGETAVPASDANPAGPPPDPHGFPLSRQQTIILPFAGEVVSRMSSMLLASCFTMFGIGANLGIVGWVIGYDLSAAPQWAHVSVVTLAALAAVIVALYGVFAIRALADTRDGSVLSGRRGAAFIL